jgi:hypothetical protein
LRRIYRRVGFLSFEMCSLSRGKSSGVIRLCSPLKFSRSYKATYKYQTGSMQYPFSFYLLHASTLKLEAIRSSELFVDFSTDCTSLYPKKLNYSWPLLWKRHFISVFIFTCLLFGTRRKDIVGRVNHTADGCNKPHSKDAAACHVLRAGTQWLYHGSVSPYILGDWYSHTQRIFPVKKKDLMSKN